MCSMMMDKLLLAAAWGNRGCPLLFKNLALVLHECRRAAFETERPPIYGMRIKTAMAQQAMRYR